MRWWAQHSKPCLTILYYHRASTGDLRSHWSYLHRHYRIVHLEKGLEELQMLDKKDVQRKDRRLLLALTFDDGYYDNYTHAFPLACELQIPMTIFLIPGHMESGNSYWWTNRLIRLAQVDQVTFEERTYHLDCQEECKALGQVIDACFSQCASSIERQKFVASLYKILEAPSSVVLKEQPIPLLTWAQVREMQKSGWVSFGAHTVHHPKLADLANPVEVQREVGECRAMLEKELGHPIRTFAYPFGSIGDHGLCAVKQAGYDWAVTTVPGANTCQTDPHQLRRRKMDFPKHWLVVAAETAGIWSFFSYLKNSTKRLIRRSLVRLSH